MPEVEDSVNDLIRRHPKFLDTTIDLAMTRETGCVDVCWNVNGVPVDCHGKLAPCLDRWGKPADNCPTSIDICPNYSPPTETPYEYLVRVTRSNEAVLQEARRAAREG